MVKNSRRANPWADADVERHWDSVAQQYRKENERVGSSHTQRYRVAVPWLRLKAGLRILNVSSRDCAAEHHIRCTQPEVEIVHAEISRGLIDVASKLQPQARQVKLRDYSHLPFDSSYFDRVLSLETLEHVHDPLAFLKELYRVSTENAQLVLSCPPGSCEAAYRLYTLVCGGHGEGPHRFLPSGEVKQLLTASGWRLKIHSGTLLVPIGPRWLKNLGERFIERHQGGLIAEMGIRQFYVCHK